MVRKFNLYNARGEMVELLSDKLFALSPTGLGVSLENSYSQYQTYMIRTNSKVTQGSFQTNIVFSQIKSQTYQQFSDFAQFLAYQPYTLEYVIDSGNWKRDAYLKELPKSEAATAGLIDEQITLEFINNWYNNKTAEYNSYDPDPNLGTYGKIYNYTYQPYYVYIESNRNSTEKMMSLVNKSQYFGLQKGSPCIITISSSPTDTLRPSWSVIKNGSIVATDGVLVSISENQKLVVSSYPEDQYARVYNPDGSYADVSQLQDFTKTNFVQIPEGDSTVLFYVDNQATVNLTFKEERLLV